MFEQRTNGILVIQSKKNRFADGFISSLWKTAIDATSFMKTISNLT